MGVGLYVGNNAMEGGGGGIIGSNAIRGDIIL